MEVVKAIFDGDDIRWVRPGQRQVSGVDVGMEQVFANLGKCLELTAGTYNVVGDDHLGCDDHAVALARLTVQRGDMSLVPPGVRPVRLGRLLRLTGWLRPGPLN
jgi:hypothetical protein